MSLHAIFQMIKIVGFRQQHYFIQIAVHGFQSVVSFTLLTFAV